MWGNESFGGGGGGGGFMPSDGKFSSPAQGDKGGQRVKRNNNVFPVSVKQILASTEEGLKFNDIEASCVCIVGLIKSVEDTSTKISYVIEDQTGSIEAIYYIGGDDNARPCPLEEGVYARLFGSLRTTKGATGTSKYLIVFKAVQVLDMNEITTHGLEVLCVPIRLRKYNEKKNAQINSGADPALPNSMLAAPSGEGNNFGGPDTISGLTANQNMVFRCIKSVKGEEGISVDQVIANLKNKIPPKDIQVIVEFLSGEGHIYSTTDDNHFKCTDW